MSKMASGMNSNECSDVHGGGEVMESKWRPSKMTLLTLRKLSRSQLTGWMKLKCASFYTNKFHCQLIAVTESTESKVVDEVTPMLTVSNVFVVAKLFYLLTIFTLLLQLLLLSQMRNSRITERINTHGERERERGL